MKTTHTFTAVALTAGMLLGTAAIQAQYQQGPPPPPPGAYGQGPGGWDAPPQEFADDAHRRGFHDGIEGAQKDYGNHREPNVNNRDEYRHPHVPRELRHDYREGFRRGYDTGVRHMMGDHDHDHDHDGDRH